MNKKDITPLADTEESVRQFYDNYGWIGTEGKTGEDVEFRKFRPSYYSYHQHVEKRVEHLFDGLDGDLLIAGCGDVPDSHVTIAEKFTSVCCVDISHQALQLASKRLPESTVFLH